MFGWLWDRIDRIFPRVPFYIPPGEFLFCETCSCRVTPYKTKNFRWCKCGLYAEKPADIKKDKLS